MSSLTSAHGIDDSDVDIELGAEGDIAGAVGGAITAARTMHGARVETRFESTDRKKD